MDMLDQLRRIPLLDSAYGIWLRRRRLAVLALLVPLSATVGLTVFVPKLYRSTAHVIVEAQRRGLRNFSVYCNHVLTPSAIQSILDAPEVRELGRVRVDGFIGPSHIPFEAHFTPAVEIGWRLAGAHWGRGYATEGARAALEAGFTQLGLSEIVAMTVPANARSRRVMERIGMTRDPADDFDHPRLADGDPLRRHVLYRISGARWRAR